MLGSSETVLFEMPVWTPGSYLVREFSRNVLEFAPKTRDGVSLDFQKVSKNGWLVESKGTKEIILTYRVYAHEFTVDTSYLDDRHCIINGASVFMYVKGLENSEIILTVIPTIDWRAISTGLPPIESAISGQKNFIAENYDILIDSPIEIGNQSSYVFDVSGIPHEVSIYGLEKDEHERLVQDIRTIVVNSWTVFGEIPYSRYLFLVDFSGDGWGGLEHLNSTHCIAPRLRMQPIEEYHLLLTLFSHEYFHAWNVKRMRPKGLGPFDYTKETFTTSLWVAEGITSYYENLILRRASIFNVGEYLDAFAADVNVLTSLPGTTWQSAEESSFDTWIKFYRPDDNSPNTVSSYYIQGAIIGWMLDMEIRKNSESSKSLDDVMRRIYSKTFKKRNRGYSEEEFESACNEFAGNSQTEKIFQSRVRGRDRVDIDKYLSYAGLRLSPKPKNTERKEHGFLGVKLRLESGRTFVANRLFDSPAESSGLSAGDEIIAADGMRVDQTNFEYYMSNKPPGSNVKITIARDGLLQELTSKLGTKLPFEHRIYKLEKATEEQKEIFKKWLIQDWDEEISYPEYAPSPLRKIALDYV